MSGMGISEFEDSLWDEFFRFDQMVPSDGLECSNDHIPLHDSLRNALCEVNSNSSHSKNGSVSRCTHLGRKQGGCSSLHDKCSSMSDTDSWSCKQSAVFLFSSESDLMDESSSVAFDDTRESCHGFKISSTDSHGGDFPENGTYRSDRKTPVDNRSEITHQESSFSSFENIDSTDFFSGVCPDIQSFEDVEMMFRSPDSTFGVGVDEDELSWLSPDNDGGGFRFEFSCPMSSTDANMSEDRDSSKSYQDHDSAMASAPIKFKEASEKSDSDISFVNEPAVADNKDGFIPRDDRVGINDALRPSISTNSPSKTNCGGEIDVLKKQFKPLNQLKGIRKKHNSGKGSCRYLSNLPIKAIQLHSGATSYEDPSALLQQQQQQQQEKQALGLLNHISNAPLEKSHLPDQTSANQPPPAVKWIEKIEKQRNDHDNGSSVTRSLEDENIMGQAYESGSLSVGKQVHLYGDKFEDTIDADGVSLVNPAKLGSSIKQESSTQSMDEISPEAASFCQLQLVMEWMDTRTRLCIRDGLYRLAQGAGQRHNHANLRCSSGDRKTSGGLFITEGANKCTNFTNMEAGTNTIDRSIADLLFHHPSDSCAIPAHDS
ncbi:protein LNK1-like isoform X2 [Henckelia pumila]|uniref:protein LNK1-like isoform X2 n=1 Tax=Henckelia pumila TaxID=405737 RepID=UPI003C6E823A